MLSEETIEFWEKSHLQLNDIQGNELRDSFERFNVAFILYNRLYDEVPPILQARGIEISKNAFQNDKDRATDFPIQFLGAGTIVAALNDQGLTIHFERLAKLIDDEIFSMKFSKDSVPDRAADLALAANLKSLDDPIRVSALLNLIYQARNNRIHGRKHYEPHQILLLEPINAILITINRLLFNELSK